jgi:hypothetical protein
MRCIGFEAILNASLATNRLLPSIVENAKERSNRLLWNRPLERQTPTACRPVELGNKKIQIIER